MLKVYMVIYVLNSPFLGIPSKNAMDCIAQKESMREVVIDQFRKEFKKEGKNFNPDNIKLSCEYNKANPAP